MDASKVSDLSEIKRSGIGLCGKAPPVLIPAGAAPGMGFALLRDLDGGVLQPVDLHQLEQ